MSGLPVSNPQDEPGESTGPPARQILVPDVCVGVKWYVPEPDSGEVVWLLDPRFELHVPMYFFTEAASVLQRKVAVFTRCRRPRAWPHSSSSGSSQ